MNYRTPLLLVLAAATLYFGAAAFVLRFEASRILFPYVAPTASASEPPTYRVPGRSGNVMLVRRYGNPVEGCVVFFPGQHGGVPSYERTLFRKYVTNGIAVFALSYPGQDGAPGRSDLGDIQPLVQRALILTHKTCPAAKTVFVGRSLGAMLAAYAAGVSHPAGLVLEGAAPSLSSAILVRLRAHWYLSPISLLPITRLLSHDYSLVQGLSGSPPFPVVVFQGTADEQTPIAALRAPGALPAHASLVAVERGTHSNTYQLAIGPSVQTVLRMVRGDKTSHSAD